MTEQPTSPEPNEPVTSDVPEITPQVPEAVVEPTTVFEPVTSDAPAPQVTPPPAPPVPPAAPAAAAPAAAAPAAAAAAPPQWPAAGYPAQQYPQAPPGYPPAVPVYAAPSPTSTNAVVALVLAVASWVVCPIVAAVVALIFAHQGDKEIAASGGRVQGQGLITAAKWVAWINIGLMLAGIVAMGFLFLMIAVAGGLNAN